MEEYRTYWNREGFWENCMKKLSLDKEDEGWFLKFTSGMGRKGSASYESEHERRFAKGYFFYDEVLEMLHRGEISREDIKGIVVPDESELGLDLTCVPNLECLVGKGYYDAEESGKVLNSPLKYVFSENLAKTSTLTVSHVGCHMDDLVYVQGNFSCVDLDSRYEDEETVAYTNKETGKELPVSTFMNLEAVSQDVNVSPRGSYIILDGELASRVADGLGLEVGPDGKFLFGGGSISWEEKDGKKIPCYYDYNDETGEGRDVPLPKEVMEHFVWEPEQVAPKFKEIEGKIKSRDFDPSWFSSLNRVGRISLHDLLNLEKLTGDGISSVGMLGINADGFDKKGVGNEYYGSGSVDKSYVCVKGLKEITESLVAVSRRFGHDNEANRLLSRPARCSVLFPDLLHVGEILSVQRNIEISTPVLNSVGLHLYVNSYSNHPMLRGVGGNIYCACSNVFSNGHEIMDPWTKGIVSSMANRKRYDHINSLIQEGRYDEARSLSGVKL